jgi:glucose/arabinose dehydrogenase
VRSARPAARFSIATVVVGLLFGMPARATVPRGFVDELVVSGLDQPVGMAFLPDGRLLVVEQHRARIRLIVHDAIAPVDPVAVVPDVVGGDERGLLGIAVDPGWPTRPYVYVHHNIYGAIRISRFTVGGDLGFTGDGRLTIDPATRYDLIDDIPDIELNHSGGTLRFGTDGKLYVSLGEDGYACDAQSPSNLRGVILRLEVSQLPGGSGGPASRQIITPPDNPLIDSTSPDARLVWAWGLRNPFRFSVDAATGDLFIADVGEGNWEEIDRAPAGGLDFGWPLREGPDPHSYPGCALTSTAIDPIFAYDRGASGEAAVIGGVVYHAPPGASRAFPSEYEGDYFFSDYYSGALTRLVESGGSWTVAAPVAGQPSPSRWADGLRQASDYLIAPDGSLYYCRQGVNFSSGTGQIRRIAPAGSRPDSVPFSVEFVPPFPLPAPGFANLVYDLGQSARVELVLYDIRGRVTRHLLEPMFLPPGRHAEIWDGLDDEGRAVRPGIYFARLIVNGVSFDRRLPLIR